MHQLRIRVAVSSLFLLMSLPTHDADQLLTPAGIFGDAAPFQKLIILTLESAILAAAGISAVKVVRGQGGSSFVSTLRVAGPLLGMLGATYSTLNGFIGLSNVATPPPITVIAPGVAESLFVFGLGILAATVAVIGCWAMQARSRAAIGAA